MHFRMRLPKSRRLGELPQFFKALSDPTRLRLLNLLSEGEVCVCFLSDGLRLVQPKISRHLAYLKKAGLVQARREGKWMHYAWARTADPVTRSLMDGLRDWMAKDEAMVKERSALKRICC
jgi:ArsR family transcriptional regulator